VTQYRGQQEESNRWTDLARMDILNNLPSLFQRLSFCIHMGQNCGCPDVEADQFGDAYYLSQINLFLFAINNNSRVNGVDNMNTYSWHKKEGKRGANNIVSCLLMDLRKRGYLTGKHYGSLTFVAGNCGGQNKNQTVLWFLMWLVEVGFF